MNLTKLTNDRLRQQKCLLSGVTYGLHRVTQSELLSNKNLVSLGMVRCGEKCQKPKEICYTSILHRDQSTVQYKIHRAGNTLRSSFNQPPKPIIGAFDTNKERLSAQISKGTWMYKCAGENKWKKFPSTNDCESGKVFALSIDCLVRYCKITT